MIHTLENSAVQLEVNPVSARWSVTGKQRWSPSLENVQVSLSYQRGWSSFKLLDRWPETSIRNLETSQSPHGPLRKLQIDIAFPNDFINCKLVFAVPDEQPLLLWKLVVENQGSRAVSIHKIELLTLGYIYPGHSGLSGSLNFPLGGFSHSLQPLGKGTDTYPKDLVFYSNGWQSWSPSGLYLPEQRYRLSRLGFLRTPVVKNASTPHPRREGMIVSDMFGVLGERTYRNGLLVGFLSQKEQFGSLETWLGGISPTLSLWASGDGARLDPGREMTTDWACLQFFHLDTPDPLAPYLDAVARESQVLKGGSTAAVSPVGWCSWYQFSSEDYTGLLTGEDVIKNLDAMQELKEDLPLEIIQIDDGYQSEIGDWFSFNESFPEGLTPLASAIHQAGFTPGVWLAPFIAHPKSRLAAQPPDWLLRDRLKRPVNAGFLWGTFMRGLDLTHPDAMAYVKDVIHTAVDDWGFQYLKLDFLYAAALTGRYRDSTRTRAQVVRAGLEAVRDAAGEDTFLLGSGCPIGSAIGLVDAMRIGADTARRWKSSYRGIHFFIQDELSFPSARNALQNALVRSNLHRRWWINDPDCLLLRPETHLTLEEVQTIASVITLTGGSLLLSDHLPDLPPDRRRIAASLLPLIGERPYILDWFDNMTPERVQLDLEGPTGSWHLLGLFNWQEESKDLTLRQRDFYLETSGEMYAREFWSGETYILPDELNSPEGLTFKGIPPHGVVLFALQPRRKYRPQYLGGDLHISQGLEVIEWRPDKDGLQLTIERSGCSHGRIDLAIPNAIDSAYLNGEPVLRETFSEGCYSFELEFERRASLEINYR